MRADLLCCWRSCVSVGEGRGLDWGCASRRCCHSRCPGLVWRGEGWRWGGGKGHRSATHRHNTSGTLWGNADWSGRPHPGWQKFTLFFGKQRFSTGGAWPKSGSQGCFDSAAHVRTLGHAPSAAGKRPTTAQSTHRPPPDLRDSSSRWVGFPESKTRKPRTRLRTAPVGKHKHFCDMHYQSAASGGGGGGGGSKQVISVIQSPQLWRCSSWKTIAEQTLILSAAGRSASLSTALPSHAVISARYPEINNADFKVLVYTLNCQVTFS